MKTCLIGLTAALAAGVCSATDYTWQAVEGSYDGLFSDPAHWGQTEFYPGQTTGSQTAVFPAAADRTSRIYFPDGTYDNYSGFRLYVANGQSTWLIGTNTTWTLATPPEGTSRSECFVYLNIDNPPKTKNGTAFRATPTGDVYKNFKLEYSNKPGRGTVLDVWEGDLTTTPNWFFFDNNKWKDKTGRFELCFHPGTRSTISGRTYTGTMNATNALTFLGGTHTIANWSPQFNVGNPDSGTSNRVEITFRGGATVDFATLSFGFTGTPNSKALTHVVKAYEGAKVSTKSSTCGASCGIYDFDISGAGTVWNNQDRFQLGWGKDSHVKFRVADGAQFTCGALAYFGAQTAADLENNTMEVVITNAAVTLNSQQAFTMYSGSLSVIDSTFDIGWKSSLAGTSASGGNPTCYLNGVRSVLTTTSTPIGGFATVSLGDRGYTLYSQHPSNPYTIAQSFSDAPGEKGELKLGTYYPAYPYTLSAANSTESRLVIENGTTKLASGANHYSHLIVKSGATFSMKDNASTTTLRGLTLGSSAASAGTFELDPNDTVRVEGPVSFTNGVFKYTSTLPYGTKTVFTSTAATAAEIEDWQIGVGFTIDGLPAGAFVTYDTTESDGVTSFQVIVKESVPAKTGEKSWTGEGQSAAWDDVGNWGGTKPSATERAVFDGTTPTAVTISGKEEAAGLSFATGGYSLTGGTLKLMRTTGTPLISVAAGTVEIASNLQLTEFIGLRADVYVAEGATLVLSGRVLGGGINKTGPGKLVLNNAANRMPQGFQVCAGLLSAADSLALGGATVSTTPSLLQADTLEITGNASGGVPGSALDVSALTASDPVVIKADADATLRLGVSTGASIFKRGAGAFAFQADVDRTFDLESYQSTSVTASSDVQFTDDGAAPTVNRGSINVVEGELAFRSPANKTVTLSRKASMGSDRRRIFIPYPTTAELAAEPKFVLDGTQFSASGHEFLFGACLSASATATKPELIVTNGAVLTDWMYSASSSSTKPGLAPLATFDRGTLATQSFLSNGSGAFVVTNRYVFRNGSALYVTAQNMCNGPTVMTFDNSAYAYDSLRTPAQALEISSDFAGKGRVLDIAFANGSVFGCIGLKGASTSTVSAPVRLSFDASEWTAGTSSLTLPSVKVDVTTAVTGEGLKLAPAEGYTWTWVGPMVGTGGFVKDGDGTVLFAKRNLRGTETDEPTLCYEGLTDIRAGVLALAEGSVSNFVGRMFKVAGTLDLQGGSLAGATLVSAGGSVRNGTLVKPTVSVEVDGEGAVVTPLTFDGANGCVLDGRVSFDFGGRGGALGSAYTVARWTGTKPDVSRWRGVNIGDDGLCCTFVANDDGTVTGTVSNKPGMLILVR